MNAIDYIAIFMLSVTIAIICRYFFELLKVVDTRFAVGVSILSVIVSEL